MTRSQFSHSNGRGAVCGWLSVADPAPAVLGGLSYSRHYLLHTMPVTVTAGGPDYETVLRTLVWASLLSSLGISFPRSKMRN